MNKAKATKFADADGNGKQQGVIGLDYSSYVYWNDGNSSNGFQLVSTNVLEQSELDIYQTGGISH